MIKVNITSRHFKAHDTLQDYIRSEIDNLSKYNEDIVYADVILFFEKAINSIKYCEILVKIGSKDLMAKESSDDFVKSVDKAIDKIETQILKIKDKNKTDKHNTKKEITKTI
ncbi:MAG TPA: ribosome-associated translation inhibitor RaiA [Ignavibacteria bacterium]|nr:ribosome-associated translation inhibitor RaiA [Ignavibacteria bacterium]HQY51706.1 ribosome-associated translation inhibitor RaiA [Ignavibacteria bacterium]HRA99511.1 ribosome-associated translation inhibitor RaiA [Ignavibacteria bacterium]